MKRPIDLFIGKSSVQTNVYVFRVGEAHQKDNTVKFINFSVDGYTRTNRKKASRNLRDTDHAKERYAELVDLVRFGKTKLNIFTEKEYYEGKIEPKNGADWNQTAPIDTKPTLDGFKKTVSDYLAWEVEGSDYNYITHTSINQGILQVTGFVNQENINEAGTWSLGLLQMDFFYHQKPWYAGQFVRKEAERVVELTAYLTSSGLDNYELSSKETIIIETLKKTNTFCRI